MALVEGTSSWNSPGHGSIDSQSCGVGVTESSCRDRVHGLALPAERGIQSERLPTRVEVGGKEKEEKGKVLSAQSALFSFDQNTNLGDCTGRIKGKKHRTI